MNAKISVFVICVEAIMYLLLYNMHDCTFNPNKVGLFEGSFIHISRRTYLISI